MGSIKKAITFSYDDAITQDIRLVEIFNKYGLKATFNLNSGLLGREDWLLREGVTVSQIKNKAADIRAIYAGHEIAAHTLTHPRLPELSDEEIIRQVEADRLALSRLAGYEVVGFAYPYGEPEDDGRIARLLAANTGIRYARGVKSTGSFDPWPDLFQFRPTCHHHRHWEELDALADRFLALEPEKPALFYIWGHGYEFDIYPERWQQFEAFCAKIAGRPDIFYGTNKEVLLSQNWG